MISIKGFGSNTNLSKNTYGVVNNIGELSAYSQTYSKDRGIYYQNDTDAVVLTTFSTKRQGKETTLTIQQREHIISIIKWVYQNAAETNAVYTTADLMNKLIEQFGTVADSWKSGEIVGDEAIWVPQWISWKMKNQSEETQIRIWFSDQSFRRSYDEYEIVVVPPLANIDDFFKIPEKLKTLLAERTPTKRMEEAQAAKQSLPETIIRTDTYEWINPSDDSEKIPTAWDVLIYGEYGDNIDSVKDAIINYILANTRKSREEWMRIFPEIFKRTEFTMVPDWDRFAIPNRVTEAGIYSPFLNVGEILPELKKFTNLYTDKHVERYAQVMSHPYRSLQIITCGGTENRDMKYQITDYYPDYIAQHSLSQDFNRQSESTKGWAELIAKMLVVAEEMTPYTDIPRGMTKLIRNDKLYIVAAYENVHYLIAAKYNYTTAN